MADQIPDLWPVTIETSVLSPIAILQFQASQLRARTKGILEAVVKIWESKENQTVYEFAIVVAALDGYRYLLFTAWHTKDFIYPVKVKFREWDELAEAEYQKALVPQQGSILSRLNTGELPSRSGIKSADTPAEFVALLRQLLGSSQAKSVLMSLIARVNDVESAAKPPSTQAVEDATLGDNAKH
jgi:hypothetical protein